MSNRRKNAQNCWFFRRALSSFLSKNPHEWVHQGGFYFVLGTRIVSWNTNCSRIVQNLMRHLMRQWMGINGETVLARSAPKKNWERFVREQPFKTVTFALQTARQTLRNPPQKQKNADFLNFFESKSCTVQKVAVLLHSLTEKTGMPVSSERQQKFFEKIP